MQPGPLPFRKAVAFSLAVLVAFFVGLELAVRVFLPEAASTEMAAEPRTPDEIVREDHPAELAEPYPPDLAAQTACRCDSPNDACTLVPPYREQTVSCAPPAGRTRVLFVGASSVWGDGLAADAAVPARLEQALRARGVDAEVVNAGVSGWELIGCRYTLQYLGPRLRPDLVVLYAGHNEIYPMIRTANTYSFAVAYPVASRMQAVFRHSALARAGAYLWKRERSRRARDCFAGEDGYAALEPARPIALTAEEIATLSAFRAGLVERAGRRLVEFASSAERIGATVLYVTPTSNRRIRPLSTTHGPGYARASAEWETKMAQAQAAEGRGDYDGAIALLRELAEIDPNHALTHYLLGRDLIRAGRPLEAWEFLSRALDELYLYTGDPTLEGAPPSMLAEIAEKAAAAGMPVWDAGTERRGGSDPTDDLENFRDYVHYSERGASLLAEALADHLVAGGFVPSSSRSITP